MSENDGGPAFPAEFVPGWKPDGVTKIWKATGGMTLREYAAIHLKQPHSGNPLLDEMIREARRDDFARAALTGILASGEWEAVSREGVITEAFALADLALKIGEWDHAA